MSWQLHWDAFVRLRYPTPQVAGYPSCARSSLSLRHALCLFTHCIARYRLHPFHALTDVIGFGSEVNTPIIVEWIICWPSRVYSLAL
jgi:hypothetical protein